MRHAARTNTGRYVSRLTSGTLAVVMAGGRGERLKALMETHPSYVLKAAGQISPVFENPLGLFDPDQMGDKLEDRYGIPRRRLTGLMSPWAVKRLDEFGKRAGSSVEIEKIGESIEGRSIHHVRIGTGPMPVLLWRFLPAADSFISCL